MVVGTGSGAPLYEQIENIAGSPASSVGYCHGTLSTEGFVAKMKELGREKNFPLELPEMVLKQGRGQVERDVDIKPPL